MAVEARWAAEPEPGWGAADGATEAVLAPGRFVEGRMPSLSGATEWLNSPPLTTADLQGKVVAVQFWTYTCINWLRTLPPVREWGRAYRQHGLVVIGVHSPEFSFEHDVADVRREVLRRGITYPVAIDNDFAIWSAFANHYWPALFLVDAQGRIRHRHVGEADYGDAERAVRRLLLESGAGPVPPEVLEVTGSGVEAPADWDSLRSAETYLGYGRSGRFASPGGAHEDVPHRYSAPSRLRSGEWALTGGWSIEPELARSTADDGRLSCSFEARDVHLVMGPGPGGTVPFRIRVDGAPPGLDHGEDVGASGLGTASEPRLHDLLRQRGAVRERTIEVEFLDRGIELFALTFG